MITLVNLAEKSKHKQLPNNADALGRRELAQLAINGDKRQAEDLCGSQYLPVARVFVGETISNGPPSNTCRHRHHRVPGGKLIKPRLWVWRRYVAFRNHAGDFNQGHVADEKMCSGGMSEGGSGNAPEHGGSESVPNRRMGVQNMPHAACQSACGMTGAEGSKSFSLAVPVMEPCTIFEIAARGLRVFFTGERLAGFGVDFIFIVSTVAPETGVGKSPSTRRSLWSKGVNGSLVGMRRALAHPQRWNALSLKRIAAKPLGCSLFSVGEAP